MIHQRLAAQQSAQTPAAAKNGRRAAEG